MDLLISQGFWVDRQETGGEEGGPGVAGIPVSRGGLLGEGNVTPLQCSCLENPRDGGAWWAAVCGVTQSRTRLKRLSSSSSREGSWLLDPFQPKGSSGTVRGGPAYAVPGSRSLCPSCDEGTDVRVPYWLSPEHLEKGGSGHKNKTARIINSPSRQ